MYNLAEEIEKSFIAGAEFMREEAFGEELEMPLETEVIKSAVRYINGIENKKFD